MRRVTSLLVIASGIALASGASQAAVVFSDNFESGMGNWTQTSATAGTSLVQSAEQNIIGAGFSAKMDSSADRMHNNLNTELSGPSTFTSYIYDPHTTAAAGESTRIFNEVRGYTGTGLPDGGTTANGSLSQLFAIGKYNTVTQVGEVYNGSKYQARVVTGGAVGWFNLDGPGSPNRSLGWHKFQIERLADGTTLNFYVDDILSGTYTGAAAATWDTVVIGPGLGTTAGAGYIDGVEITNTLIPEPSSLALAGLAGLAMIRRRRA